MKTRRLITCRTPARRVATPGGDVYGLIDWDGAPILIVGSTTEAVKREAIRSFASTLLAEGSLAEDAPDFTDRHPLPNPDGPITAIDDWLTLLRQATASPWFDVLDDEVVIAR